MTGQPITPASRKRSGLGMGRELGKVSDSTKGETMAVRHYLDNTELEAAKRELEYAKAKADIATQQAREAKANAERMKFDKGIPRSSADPAAGTGAPSVDPKAAAAKPPADPKKAATK